MAITVITDFVTGIGDLLADLRIGFDRVAGNEPSAWNLLIIQEFDETLGADLAKFSSGNEIWRSGFAWSDPH